MPIQVTCPGCLTRFSVAEQYAGKEGPCPKCKGKIRIPSLEEQVVIHAPAPSGPTDAKGKSVLKTTRREDTKFQAATAAIVAGVMLVVLLAALVLRSKPSINENSMETNATLLIGAMVVGVLCSWAGYTFLRDPELEAFGGGELWIRAAACGCVYGLLWLAYGLVAARVEPEYLSKGLEIWQMLLPVALMVGVGTLTAFASFDFEPTVGFIHYAMFLGITIALRAIMNLDALPGLASGQS